ncbi:dTDP-glucose 4,6-dehydratase [Burkholderia cepacia]|uniref:NAD-dependent epimerase/dehydratase family protein n=1 Tax=Burkholderia cepacia TaxID=292 RepID=UPI00075A55E4|nr:NAD(P)-dependent oxidoreductase [Burkholderia cepacia]KVS50735.1 dTDP-glucose 4,6-dehydratase [Burkholderia cepacia]KVS65761.1 dTDP-glucose 4,6-dehydratase [Burkholderia cepacia]
MTHRVFVVGASGAIGTALVPLLVAAGYTVFGSTRRADRVKKLEDAGVAPVVVDVFDAAALRDALARIAPDSVIHQLTDLPAALDPALMAQAVAANARIRDEGTQNLVAAAISAGCKRMIAQSIAWAYRPGVTPYDENCPLDLDAQGMRRTSVRGVAALERHVLTTAPLVGTVLRYGQIYGPGTGADSPTGSSPLHVDAAAYGALLALQRGTAGVFNIAQDDAEVSSAKAKRELGWSPDMRSATRV